MHAQRTVQLHCMYALYPTLLYLCCALGDGQTATTTTVTVSVSWNLSQSVRSFCKLASTPTLALTVHFLHWSATGAVVRAGSVGRHWYNERLASVGLLALIPTGLVYPNPVVDYGLAVLIPLHGHWSVVCVCVHMCEHICHRCIDQAISPKPRNIL